MKNEGESSEDMKDEGESMTDINNKDESITETFNANGATVTDFAVNMLKAKAGDNKLVSPVSVMMAMGMVVSGSEGNTKAQILNALGTNEDFLNEAMQEIIENVEEGEKQLSFANAIWVNGSGNIKDNYAFKINDIFRAEINEDNFGPQTVQNINSFVNKNTDGQISKLLDSLDNSASMVLVDALCFDGKWDKPFEDYQITEDYDFHLTDDTTQKVTMLNGGAKDYIEFNGAKGFTFAYAGRKYSFIGLLPKEGETPSVFIQNLKGNDFINAYENREFTNVNIGIPEFEFDYGMDLSSMFQNLGVKDAFDPSAADFSAMFNTKNGQHISNIIHKTHISLDREGTKAAATTGIVVLQSAPPSFEEPKEVILDRPFIYMIFDNEAEMPLFIGQVDHF